MRSSEHNGRVSGRACASARVAFARITLRSDRREDTLRFENAIREIDDVLECVRVAGRFDYLVKYVAADESASRRLGDALVAGGLGIASCSSQLMVDTVFVKALPSSPVRLGRFV